MLIDCSRTSPLGHLYSRNTFIQGTQNLVAMQWRKWQKWQKIASLWRFELDAKSGPLETGDFDKNRQRAGDNGENRPGPLETGDFGKNGDCGEIGDFTNYSRRQPPSPWNDTNSLPWTHQLWRFHVHLNNPYWWQFFWFHWIVRQP